MATQNIVYTITLVKIEFDTDKDAKSIAKHGVSLALAESLEWDLFLATEDTREDYGEVRGEVRLVGFAPSGRRVYCVVFTENDSLYRIISLRKALPREVKAYASRL